MSLWFAYACRREVEPVLERFAVGVELGVGKSAAAATLAARLAVSRPRLVVLVGVAGAYAETRPVGSLCAVGSAVFGDEGVELADGFRSLEDLGMPESSTDAYDQRSTRSIAAALDIDVVRCATVSACSGSDARAAAYRARTEAEIETMESAAVALACRAANVSLVELRAISNACGDRDRGGWDLDAAVESLSIGVRRLLDDGVLDA